MPFPAPGLYSGNVQRVQIFFSIFRYCVNTTYITFTLKHVIKHVEDYVKIKKILVILKPNYSINQKENIFNTMNQYHT